YKGEIYERHPKAVSTLATILMTDVEVLMDTTSQDEDDLQEYLSSYLKLIDVEDITGRTKLHEQLPHVVTVPSVLMPLLGKCYLINAVNRQTTRKAVMKSF